MWVTENYTDSLKRVIGKRHVKEMLRDKVNMHNFPKLDAAGYENFQRTYSH